VKNEVNQEESQLDEVDGMKKGADSTGDAYRKERLVICNEEDAGDRASNLRVLCAEWTEIKVCTESGRKLSRIPSSVQDR